MNASRAVRLWPREGFHAGKRWSTKRRFRRNDGQVFLLSNILDEFTRDTRFYPRSSPSIPVPTAPLRSAARPLFAFPAAGNAGAFYPVSARRRRPRRQVPGPAGCTMPLPTDRSRPPERSARSRRDLETDPRPCRDTARIQVWCAPMRDRPRHRGGSPVRHPERSSRRGPVRSPTRMQCAHLAVALLTSSRMRNRLPARGRQEPDTRPVPSPTGVRNPVRQPGLAARRASQRPVEPGQPSCRQAGSADPSRSAVRPTWHRRPPRPNLAPGPIGRGWSEVSSAARVSHEERLGGRHRVSGIAVGESRERELLG